MPFLAVLWSLLAGPAKWVGSALSTPFGMACAACLAAFLIGDYHGGHSERAARETAVLEARIEAQRRDLAAAKSIADLAKSQAADAEKDRDDATQALEEVRAHEADPGRCRLSPSDADRLRHIR